MLFEYYQIMFAGVFQCYSIFHMLQFSVNTDQVNISY